MGIGDGKSITASALGSGFAHVVVALWLVVTEENRASHLIFARE